MSERVPDQVFNKPPLSEDPRRFARPLSRQQTLDVYNTVFDRMMITRDQLTQRYNNGEFAGLDEITGKLNRGETLTAEEGGLVRDYGTLLDADIAFYGRRALNAADLVERWSRTESEANPLDPAQERLKEWLQTGEYHLIGADPAVEISTDYHLLSDISRTRFEVPAREGDASFAIKDGARVDMLIRFVDQEIQNVITQPGLIPSVRAERLDALRFQRDALYTQSAPVFVNEDRIFHARNQREAYLNSIDPRRSETVVPDWFNGEWTLRDARVLNIPAEPRGRNRLGCLPWLLPLPLLIPILTGVNVNPCYGTGGQLAIENFTPEEARIISLRGANVRQMVYHRYGIPQSQYRPADNPELVRGADEIRTTDPDYFETYIQVADHDYLVTARRTRGDNGDSHWVRSTEFADMQSLTSCLSPQQRDEETRRILDRKNNPQWYHGIQDAANAALRLLPKVNIAVR